MIAGISNNRSAAVDIARLVAAAAVVWIHVTSCEASRASLPLCRFAVPFFTAAAVYFILHRAANRRLPGFRPYLAQRAQRLYLPFLLWSAFYLALRLSKHAAVHDGSPIVFSPAMLLTGSTHHLWFLPFAALVSMFVYGLARLVQRLPHPRPLALAAASVAVAALLASAPAPAATDSSSPVSYFLGHAWRAAPSVFFGAAVFWLTRRPISPGLRFIVLGVGIAAAIGEMTALESGFGPHIAGASILFFTCTQPNRRWMCAEWNWAEIAFLVYLSHVAFIEVLKTVAQRFGTGSSVASDLSLWALAFVLSVVTAHYTLELRAFRRRSRVVVPRLA